MVVHLTAKESPSNCMLYSKVLKTLKLYYCTLSLLGVCQWLPLTGPYSYIDSLCFRGFSQKENAFLENIKVLYNCAIKALLLREHWALI